MWVRNTGYDDYGFKPGEERELLKRCRSGGPDLQAIILAAAIEANAGVAGDLFYSIVRGWSYERLCTPDALGISKVDFYGYRRKTLAIIKNALHDEL